MRTTWRIKLKHKENGSIDATIVAVLLLALAVGGFAAWRINDQNTNSKSTEQTTQNTIENDATEKTPVSDMYLGWNAFDEESFDFTMRFPATTEDGSSWAVAPFEDGKLQQIVQGFSGEGYDIKYTAAGEQQGISASVSGAVSVFYLENNDKSPIKASDIKEAVESQSRGRVSFAESKTVSLGGKDWSMVSTPAGGDLVNNTYVLDEAINNKVYIIGWIDFGAQATDIGQLKIVESVNFK